MGPDLEANGPTILILKELAKKLEEELPQLPNSQSGADQTD